MGDESNLKLKLFVVITDTDGVSEIDCITTDEKKANRIKFEYVKEHGYSDNEVDDQADRVVRIEEHDLDGQVIVY